MSLDSYTRPKPGVAVVLANGLFPRASLPMGYLKASDTIVCCDGAADALVQSNLEPVAIVGDLDSVSDDVRQRYGDRLVEIREQETNDLTKAIFWLEDHGCHEAVVLGADGKRIDHTIANAALIAEHSHRIKLSMVTNEGILVPVSGSTRFPCAVGEQVSIFSLVSETRYTSTGLKYELKEAALPKLWAGSLNEAIATEFTLEFASGTALVFITQHDAKRE